MIAEAFNIDVQIDLKNEQDILDFDAVRVSEPKEQSLAIKNVGMYPFKYGFLMKKKATRDMFKIEPMEGTLEPNEEKTIVVRFQSEREIRLKTNKNTSDIKLTILEGKSQEKYSEVPINVNVNAVFSKYSITPPGNINFGPMQYEEKKKTTFEIKNEGLFEFKYAICDYKDQEAKARIREEREREVEERRKAALGIAEEGAGDPKAKKADPKAPPPKGGKADPKAPGGAPEGGLLQVSQYAITPSSGSIAPGSSAIVNIEFAAVGAQFYESTLAIDISGRDPND